MWIGRVRLCGFAFLFISPRWFWRFFYFYIIYFVFYKNIFSILKFTGIYAARKRGGRSIFEKKFVKKIKRNFFRNARAAPLPGG